MRKTDNPTVINQFTWVYSRDVAAWFSKTFRTILIPTKPKYLPVSMFTAACIITQEPSLVQTAIGQSNHTTTTMTSSLTNHNQQLRQHPIIVQDS